MAKVILLKQNSEDIRRQIREAGIDVCICAAFADSIWLDFYPSVGSVHGIGYAYEGMTPEETILFIEHEWKKYDTEVVLCMDVEGFIEKIKEYGN